MVIALHADGDSGLHRCHVALGRRLQPGAGGALHRQQRQRRILGHLGEIGAAGGGELRQWQHLLHKAQTQCLGGIEAARREENIAGIGRSDEIDYPKL